MRVQENTTVKLNCQKCDVPQYVTTCITTAYRYSAMAVASTANTLAKFKYKFTSATSSTTLMTLWRCKKEEQSGGRD